MTPIVELLLLHAIVDEEKAGAKLVLPGTLHATWPSAVGLEPATKVQALPKVHGRGPLTVDMLPPNWYLQLGTTVAQAAGGQESRLMHC